MTKGLSTNLQNEINSNELQMRMLVTIYLDDVTHRLCANDTGNIVFNGNTYYSCNIKRGELVTTAQGTASDERIRLHVEDKNQIVSLYASTTGNKFNNRRCLIQEVSLNHLTNSNDIVTVFDGVTNSLRIGAGHYIFDVIRSIGSYQEKSPNWRFSPMCGVIKFKDSRCGYTGSETLCDRSKARCIELGNIENFRGFPSVPSEMVIGA